MKRMIAFVFTVVFLISFAARRESAPLSNEDGNISCEVKLLLNSDLVLDEDGLLSETVLEKLMLDREYGNYEAAFLDTADRTYLSTGWVNRIHMKEGKKKYTVRFKKRFKVTGQDLESALAAAEAEGFSRQDPQFEAEADWGYDSMTLSFTNETAIKTKNHFPQGNAAIETVAKNIPSAEKSAAGGQLEVVGPLKLKRYNGAKDDRIRVEVWEIADQEPRWYITEYSFKCESMQEAAKRRDSAIRMLDELGILMHEGGLKTEMILLGRDAVKTAD